MKLDINLARIVLSLAEDNALDEEDARDNDQIAVYEDQQVALAHVREYVEAHGS